MHSAGMNLAQLLLAALPLMAQAAPQVPPPIAIVPTPVPAPAPWYKELYLLRCRVIDAAGGDESFMLTLADDKAAIAGGEGLGLPTGGFVEIEADPPVIRGQARMRRLTFDAGSNTIFVRQLFEGDELSSTFVVVGRDAASDRTMSFEHAAGFCTQLASSPEPAE